MLPSILLALEMRTSFTSSSPKFEASRSDFHYKDIIKHFTSILVNWEYRVIVKINNQVVYFSAGQRACDFSETLSSQVSLQVADQAHYKNIL